MIQLSTVSIGSSDPKKLSDFYEKVFETKPDMVEGDWCGWKTGNVFFVMGSHSDITGQSKEPARIMVNFETREVDKEFDRISKIDGVTVIAKPYEMGGGKIATFADPDGNYFQLNSPWE